MDREVKKLLHDISESLSSVESYIGNKKVFSEYQNNKLIKRAVEREFEIIGEAMKRLLAFEPNIRISDPRRIVNFRNRISHGYDTLDDTIVWGIIVNHLPQLKTEIEQLLAS
jgi:uncharacterized protein with HEPN domain